MLQSVAVVEHTVSDEPDALPRLHEAIDRMVEAGSIEIQSPSANE